MDWTTYKRLCDRPDYWSRWMLEQCAQLLSQLHQHQLCAKLREITMAQLPLATPADHQGSADLDMFELTLSRTDRIAILAAIKVAVARKLSTPQTAERGLGGFVAAWEEYCGYAPVGDPQEPQRLTRTDPQATE